MPEGDHPELNDLLEFVDIIAYTIDEAYEKNGIIR